jgi:hypothetical protein
LISFSPYFLHLSFYLSSQTSDNQLINLSFLNSSVVTSRPRSYVGRAIFKRPLFGRLSPRSYQLCFNSTRFTPEEEMCCWLYSRPAAITEANVAYLRIGYDHFSLKLFDDGVLLTQ